MPIETLDDIVEGLADLLGIYERREAWVLQLKGRILDATRVEQALATDATLATLMESNLKAISTLQSIERWTHNSDDRAALRAIRGLVAKVT